MRGTRQPGCHSQKSVGAAAKSRRGCARNLTPSYNQLKRFIKKLVIAEIPLLNILFP